MNYALPVLMLIASLFIAVFALITWLVVDELLKSTQKPPETPQADISVMGGRMYMSKQIMAKNHRITIN